jgi:hypothetical protein
MKWLSDLSFPSLLLLSLALTQTAVVAQPMNRPEGGDTLPTRTTSWKPTILYGQNLSSEESTRLTLSLSDRRHSGRPVAVASTTTNEFRGFYEVNGDLLRIRFESQTAVMTPIGGDVQASSFMKAIRETSHFIVQGSRLELLNQGGTVIASLIRKD